MKRPVALHKGRLLWLGEHWINALRPEGAEKPSAWISLFHTRWSPAGEGNAAQVIIAGEKGLSVICADNRGLGEWANREFFARSTVRDPSAPIVEARFRREGDLRRDPAWVIETGGHRVVARWRVTDPPVIADGSFREGTEHFTALFFTDDAEVGFDGQRVPGKPYPRDIWKPSIGGERSSCVIALAETFIALAGLPAQYR